MRRVEGAGPLKAKIVIVGEAPGEEEELEGKPFVGPSGRLLNTMLREAGIRRDECYVTNVCKYRPPGNKIEAWLTDKKKLGVANEWEQRDGRYYSEEIAEGLSELWPTIAAREPSVVVGLGNTALWALSGEWGIMDWRGSEMLIDAKGRVAEYDGAESRSKVEGRAIQFVPTIHPAAILRNWPVRAFAANDLKQRVARRLRDGFERPAFKFNWQPTLPEVLATLANLQGDVAVDVETSRGQIVCVGIAWSSRNAMCIPFINEGYGAYWSALDSQIVVAALQKHLLRPDVNVVGQNFNYDASYFDDNFDFLPRVSFDTLIAQSVLFPGVPRGLGFLSSMYCDWHCYWKDDARDWANLRDFDRLFRYNCRDVCATWEAAQNQRKMVARVGLVEQVAERTQYNHAVYDMMDRGVIRDPARTLALDEEIEDALQERKIIICDAAGAPINPTSPVQVSKLLYDQWGCRKPARRGKAAGGTGDEELRQVAAWHPERAAVCTAILEHRSLASMRANFLRAKLDPDGRLRSSFMATGTETFRLTSSKNNFGRGTNLLNLSGSGTTHSGNKVPNFRCAIVPPSGYTVFDCDLARADLQIVVWEADDADLKEKMRADVDLHYENAKDVFGTREPTPVQREKGKKFVHLTNYGGKARTCAIGVGLTVHEADMAQRRWFGAHPGIEKWHKRVDAELVRTRTIVNPFGYKMTFFDRVEGLLPEALAWIPQSTVAIVASKVHMAIDRFAFEKGLSAEVWLQMYDSVMGVYKMSEEATILPLLHEATKVVVPYADPLIIPMGLNRSDVSWGDCKSDKRGW